MDKKEAKKDIKGEEPEVADLLTQEDLDELSALDDETLAVTAEDDVDLPIKFDPDDYVRCKDCGILLRKNNRYGRRSRCILCRAKRFDQTEEKP